MIFVASLANYNQSLWEDETENAMHDQLQVYFLIIFLSIHSQLFDELINGRHFMDTATILLLNKKDLFQEKIKTVPLSVCFSDYEEEGIYLSSLICE